MDKKQHQFDICILFPTRGRTNALMTSIASLLDTASGRARLQFLIGLDSDDTVGKTYFQDEIIKLFDERDIAYTALEFAPMGYVNLEKYYNALARHSDSDWMFIWNDDAIMKTANWDQEILSYSGQFRLLRVRTHMSHPYSIFPIWPREWYDIFNHVSRHQMIDAEMSQMAYFLDIMQNVDIDVVHDRYDLTGNNLDSTQINKKVLEGNPSDPRDFHHPDVTAQRFRDLNAIAQYLESRGDDLTFFKNVLAKKQDPWEKMRANDPNQLTIQM